jgi:23S rRNA (adenine2030-N6)-methyltransferase
MRPSRAGLARLVRGDLSSYPVTGPGGKVVCAAAVRAYHEARLNYRHAFHAGNFADLVKHAGLTACLARLIGEGGPLDVLDTHAGAGLYDLSGEAAAKSGEAAGGIARLMAAKDAPPVFGALKAAVRAVNGGAAVRLYPGSPVIVARALRPQDRLTACELRPDDFALLGEALKPLDALVRTVRGDGYALAAERGRPSARRLLLIDPPFEHPDEAAQVVRAASAALGRDPSATLMIWLPIKDLESFDSILREIERAGVPSPLVAEARLRRLDQPWRMNGCALLVINDPPGLAEDLQAVCGWVAGALGEAGAEARIWRL